jgi:hypothetical protein
VDPQEAERLIEEMQGGKKGMGVAFEGPPPPAARLTVVAGAYHHSAGGTPTQAPLKFARRLSTDEQPWPRRGKAGPDWRPLFDPEKCWLQRVGYLVLANEGAGPRRTYPTPEEKQYADSLVLELAVQPPKDPCHTMHDPPQPGPVAFGFVRPGEGLCIEPASAWLVRCGAGEAGYSLTLFPE